MYVALCKPELTEVRAASTASICYVPDNASSCSLLFAPACTDFQKTILSKEQNSFEDTQRTCATHPYSTLFSDIVADLLRGGSPDESLAKSVRVIQNP